MLNKVKQSKQQGFTIIEVMIVLAIAGLIMVVVFLAVPALQRNSRNTTLKNDASALAAGFSEYNGNNNGGVPASIAQSGATVTIGAASTAQSKANVSAGTVVNATKLKPTTNKYGELWWQTGAACDGTSNARSIAVYYYVEGNSSTTPQCVDGN